MSDSPSILMMVAGFLLVLGPLIVVHELGHYAVGRLFGVKADVFSIGFGKELAGWTDKRGTRWKLSALPLGGYVQFAGDMTPAGGQDGDWHLLPEWEREATFHVKPLWQRALIVAAGPLTNLAFAILIFAAFFIAFGREVTPAVVDRFAPESTAQIAGLRLGDRIVEANGTAVDAFADIAGEVQLHPGEKVDLLVRRNGEDLRFTVPIAETVETDQFGNTSRIGRIGIVAERVERADVGPIAATGLAVDHTIGIMRMMVTGLGQIITGQRSTDELGGPIRIAKYSGEQLSMGGLAFVQFVALISINLAFINLLPIPALDGGHLMFYAAEAVRRKPLGQRGQEWAMRTGMALVLALMVFATLNDVASLLLSKS